ncbi:MAG: hypothetical protein JXA33_02475, partial [Anaerolineae bacterium]|nr:hypothetical protein [Anaerolineae bacterium]
MVSLCKQYRPLHRWLSLWFSLALLSQSLLPVLAATQRPAAPQPGAHTPQSWPYLPLLLRAAS